jgi:hypothetical protein
MESKFGGKVSDGLLETFRMLLCEPRVFSARHVRVVRLNHIVVKVQVITILGGGH